MTSYQKELQALRDGSKRPENYGKPWTDKEISELRALFLQCYDISYLAVLFGSICRAWVLHRAIRCTEQLRRYWNFESVGVGYLFNFEVEDRWL